MRLRSVLADSRRTSSVVSIDYCICVKGNASSGLEESESIISLKPANASTGAVHDCPRRTNKTCSRLVFVPLNAHA